MSGTPLSLLFVALCLAMLTSADATRNRRQHGGSTGEQYSSVCPSIVCPAISDTCQTVEFIIMEYEYVNEAGQRATISCQSCEYCIDVPFNLERPSRRIRRSAHHRRHHPDCSRVSCPDVPSDCDDIRMTDVLLGNTKCRQCPACYDATVFNRT